MSQLAQQNPIDSPQLWDVVTVSGVQSPGLAEIGEWKRAHDWDQKKGKGTLGATATFVGKPLAEGSIKWYLWEPEHFASWDTFLPLFKYDPTKKTAQAVDIYHPALDAIDVASVVTTKIGNIIHEGKQLYSISIDFLEYNPPPNQSAVSTPTQANGTPPAFTRQGNTANAQAGYEAEIAALLKKAQQP